VLYCFFIIGHDRRKILRFNVTRNPHALWIVQQLREAWPYTPAHRFLLLDRDAKFGDDVVSSAKAMGSEPVRTAFRSPWQNGVAERWVGSCRRDLLDHVIILHERHLKRLMSEYLRYYHEDRTHLGLAKDTAGGSADRTSSSTREQDLLLPSAGVAWRLSISFRPRLKMSSPFTRSCSRPIALSTSRSMVLPPEPFSLQRLPSSLSSVACRCLGRSAYSRVGETSPGTVTLNRFMVCMGFLAIPTIGRRECSGSLYMWARRTPKTLSYLQFLPTCTACPLRYL